MGAVTTSHINPSNHTIVDGDASLRAAEAAEQCEQLIAYLYPALQKVGVEHGLARSLAQRAMFRQAELTIGLVHGTDQARARAAHKLLRRSTVVRAKRRLRELRACDDGTALERFAASWTGHASWADSHNLLKSLGLEASA